MSDDIVLELADLSRAESEYQQQRDSLNMEASEAATKRNMLNEKVAELIEKAKEFQTLRDSANENVSVIKEKK